MLDDLSQIVNITVDEQDLGNNLSNLTVTVNGQSLIDGYDYNRLEVVAREDKRNASDAEGLYNICWEKTGAEFNIYSSSLSGHLKGLIDIRDGCNGEVEALALNDDGTPATDDSGNYYYDTEAYTGFNTSFKGVPYYQARLNSFISTFANAVNEVLKSGVSSDGENPGVAMFVVKQGTSVMSATNVTVNPDLLENPNLLATKSDVNTGEANADIMDELNDLQNEKIIDGGTGSYYLESIISDMSIDANKAESFSTNYNNLKTSIQNQRLSIMGVDTEEEAMDLLRFQQAYNLSSKMMSVMNEIYDKLINQTGV